MKAKTIMYAIITIFVAICIAMGVLVGMVAFVVSGLIGQLVCNYGSCTDPLVIGIVAGIITFAIFMFILIKEAW